MKQFKTELKDFYSVEGGTLEGVLSECTLDGEHPKWRRPAVIVVPGGAYSMNSRREGEPVAQYFLAKGFQVLS